MDYLKHKPEHFEFRGLYIDNWFSNMTPVKIEVDGILYNSVENYYQAMKTTDLTEQRVIARESPAMAKRIGRRTTHLRSDWEDVKFEIMLKALRAKFNIPEWKDKLLGTNDEILIEWNNWSDKIWGVTLDGKGNNLLGKALMQVRDELKKHD